MIDGTATLQLLIELGAAGYRIGEAHVSAGETLEQFRRVQRMYRDPHPRRLDIEIDLLSFITHPEDRYSRFFWEQYGNVLVGFLEHDISEGQPDGMTVTTAKTLVDVLQLTPHMDPTASSRRMHSLVIDQSCLFATVELRKGLLLLQPNFWSLCLLSLDTGKPHPMLADRYEHGMLQIPGLRDVHSVGGEWLLVSSTVRLGGQTSSLILRLYHWPSGVEKQACRLSIHVDTQLLIMPTSILV